MKELPEEQEMLHYDSNRVLDIGPQIVVAEIDSIYKKIARKAGFDESPLEGIGGHSMVVSAVQNLLNFGASIQILMQRGRWSKTDNVMRHLEHSHCMA